MQISILLISILVLTMINIFFVECRYSLFKIDKKVLENIEEKNKLIKENPSYGKMVCKCEFVTEGEIIDAIRRPLGAKSLDGVKRRTRAGMGRCQAGFCSPKTMEILERELSISMFDITKAGGESNMVLGLVKDSI